MGILKDIDKNLAFIKRVLFGAFLVLIIASFLQNVLFQYFPKPMDLGKWQHVVGLNIKDWVNTSLTMCIICTFMLFYRLPIGERVLSFFSPYGRMALTNYILQSVLGTFLLFGWGLGLMGQFRPIVLFVGACILFVGQCLVSKWWLQKFKYGPLEWLWRSATYLKVQPFVKRSSKEVNQVPQKQKDKAPVQV